MSFVGLDLSCERIRHTTASVDEREEFTVQSTGEIATGFTKPAWEEAEKFLQIKPSSRLPFDRDKLKALLNNRFGTAQSPVRAEVKGIGLAIPYCTAAWIRQGLTEISLGSPTVKKKSVWETPIAAAIDAYLSQGTDLNSRAQRQLVISPSPWGMEVTRLQLSAREGSNLHVELHVYVESIQEFFDEDTAAKLTEAAQALRELARDCHLTLVGAESNALVARAAEITGARVATALRDASEPVARLAAFEDRRRLLGSPFTRICPHQILGRALGVVCQNSNGDLFWRRLFAAGESIEAGLETSLQLASPPANRRALLLAEVRSPAPAWATLGRDEKSVTARYYTYKDQRFPGSDWKLQVKWLASKSTGLPGEGITMTQLPGNASS